MNDETKCKTEINKLMKRNETKTKKSINHKTK